MLTPMFEMMRPAQLPEHLAAAQWVVAHAGSLLGDLHGADLDRAALAAGLEAARQRLPFDRVPVAAHGADNEDAAHDAYFHVRRVDCASPAAYVHAIIAARLCLLDELDVDAVAAEDSIWRRIDRALADLGGSLIGLAAGRAGVALCTRADVVGSHDALRRWVRGHQVFATLTQGLLVTLRAMAAGIRAGNVAEVCHWADLCASLLRGSAAAFEFTGSFTVQEYIDVIRPSMMPPAVPIALSGLMSSDHTLLVQTMRDMRPAFKALGEIDRTRLDTLLREVGTVYDSHIHVCERFVGDQPSLLAAGRAKSSGATLLGQYKNLRTKPLDHPHRPRRLDPSPSPALVPESAPAVASPVGRDIHAERQEHLPSEFQK